MTKFHYRLHRNFPDTKISDLSPTCLGKVSHLPETSPRRLRQVCDKLGKFHGSCGRLGEVRVMEFDPNRLVPWLSGRTLVFDRRAFAVLRSTYS